MRKILIFLSFFSAGLVAQSQAPKGFETVDRAFTIKTLKSQMKYDVELLEVEPGDKVKLTLENPDDLPHNLVVAKPTADGKNDKGEELALAVLNMGEKMLSSGFIPLGHKRMVAHTGLVNPGESKTIYFEVPKADGDYPIVCTYPGHWAIMNGLMKVGKGTPKAGSGGNEGPLSNLQFKAYTGTWSKTAEIVEKGKFYKEGKAKNIDIAVAERGDNFGLVWTGTFHAERDGTYLFAVASDDGSRLFINGKSVCDADGVHGVQRGDGKIDLKKGKHDFKVLYFENGGGQELYVGVKRPGDGKELALSSGKNAGKSSSGMPIIPPLGEATIYRNFIQGAGPRAIGVGFSESQNYAFNANSMNIPLIWSGAFMDGAKHWKGRGQGFQPPNSQKVASFDITVAPLAILDAEDATWPNELQPGEPANRPVGFVFKGYELERKSRNPTFKYAFGEVMVEDAITPKGTGLVRRLSFSEVPDGLTFCVGKSNDIVGEGRVFEINGLTITLSADGRLKDGALLVPVAKTLDIDYTWTN